MKTRIWAKGKLWDVEFSRLPSQASDRDEYDIYKAVASSGADRHRSRWSISGHLRDAMGGDHDEAAVLAWYVREYRRTAEDLLEQEAPSRALLEADLPAYGPVTSGDPKDLVAREVEDMLFAVATWTGSGKFPSPSKWPVHRPFLADDPAYDEVSKFYDWLDARRRKQELPKPALDEGTSLGVAALRKLYGTKVTPPRRGFEIREDDGRGDDERSPGGRESNVTVFYSWQSDLPNATNRGLIQSALEQAIKKINETRETVDPPIILDRDTLKMPGSPDIAGTILQKIDDADVIVADVTLVPHSDGGPSSGRPSPNPNVLLELGWAAKSLGWSHVISVANLAYGKVEDLPFDLRHRRVTTYVSHEEDEDRAPARKDLATKLQRQIQTVVDDAAAGAATPADNDGEKDFSSSARPPLSGAEEAALSRFRHAASLADSRLNRDESSAALDPLRQALAIAHEFNLAAKGQRTFVLQTTAKLWIALLDVALEKTAPAFFSDARGIADGVDAFDELLRGVDYAGERRYVGKFLFAACAYYFGYERRAAQDLWTEVQERFEVGTDPANVTEELQKKIRRRWSWTVEFQRWLGDFADGELMASLTLRDALGRERTVRVGVTDFLRREIGFTREWVDMDQLRTAYEWILHAEAHRRHVGDSLILGTKVDSAVKDRIKACVQFPEG